jgi:hypothetical protein
VAARGGVVLVATHDLVRAEGILHRRVAIEDGRIVERATHVDDLVPAGDEPE